MLRAPRTPRCARKNLPCTTKATSLWRPCSRSLRAVGGSALRPGFRAAGKPSPAGRLTAAGSCSRGLAAVRRPSPACSRAAPGGWCHSARHRGSAHHRRCWPRSGLLRAAELPVSRAWGCPLQLPPPTHTDTHGAPGPPCPSTLPTKPWAHRHCGGRPDLCWALGTHHRQNGPLSAANWASRGRRTPRLASEVRGSEENEAGEGWPWRHRGRPGTGT